MATTPPPSARRGLMRTKSVESSIQDSLEGESKLKRYGAEFLAVLKAAGRV